MLKLRKTKAVFHAADLANQGQLERVIAEAAGNQLPEDLQHDFQMLSHHLPAFFPNEHAIEHMIAKTGLQRKFTEAYTVDLLPSHTRDQDWLSHYLAQGMAEKFEPIAFEHVQKYVAESAVFEGCRDFYERDLVKAQIKYQSQLLPQDLMTTLSDDFRAREMGQYEEFFRRRIVDDLTFVGLDPHVVEVGLETNAQLWRKNAMVQAFESLYYPHDTMALINLHQSEAQCQNLAEFKQVHMALWLRHREYAYYQNHQAVIDELGLATNNMLMKPKVAAKMAQKLQKYDQIYQNKLAALCPPKDSAMAQTDGLSR